MVGKKDDLIRSGYMGQPFWKSNVSRRQAAWNSLEKTPLTFQVSYQFHVQQSGVLRSSSRHESEIWTKCADPSWPRGPGATAVFIVLPNPLDGMIHWTTNNMESVRWSITGPLRSTWRRLVEYVPSNKTGLADAGPSCLIRKKHSRFVVTECARLFITRAHSSV